MQYGFSRKQLPVTAGIGCWRFHFRLFPGAIRTPQLLEFLEALPACATHRRGCHPGLGPVVTASRPLPR